MSESKYVPIEKWDTPQDGLFQIITDSWWLVDNDGNPLLSRRYRSPQCNRHQSIAERIAAKKYDVKMIPVVFVPFKPSDYIQ
jgi:hypothetical protein